MEVAAHICVNTEGQIKEGHSLRAQKEKKKEFLFGMRPADSRGDFDIFRYRDFVNTLEGLTRGFKVIVLSLNAGREHEKGY